jgi:membrane-bound lytic murein transglycosylase D
MIRGRTIAVCASLLLAATAAQATDRCPALEPVQVRWLVDGGAGPAAAPPAPPASLEPRVAFWARIWGELDSNQFLVSERQRPWKVHAEVDCRGLSAGKCDDRILQARRTAAGKMRASLDDVVAVEGRRDGLKDAFAKAGPELAAAEAMFAKVNVPPSFARLAFVESMWRTSAMSGAGAVGPYQIVQGTGDRYLMIKKGVDERRDPVRASLAAAKYLKRMKAEVGPWPLALTAYNTGPTRLRAIAKARRTKDMGRIADLGDVAGKYAGFGFAGQNYAAQVYAVARVSADWEKSAPVTTDRALRVGADVRLDVLARCVDQDWRDILKSNPSLTDDVASSKKPVPKGYVLRVPSEPLMLAADGV